MLNVANHAGSRWLHIDEVKVLHASDHLLDEVGVLHAVLEAPRSCHVL